MSSDVPLRYNDIPTVNIGVFMLQQMRKYGDVIALMDSSNGTSYSYNELIQRTERAAAGLQKMGVQSGDVICIASPNHTDYLVACYATCLICAVFQPINPTYTRDDIVRATKDCGTKFIITTPEILPKVRDATGTEIPIIIFGEADGCTSFENLLTSSNGKYSTPDLDPKTTVSMLLSSSGTTGLPKAVKHSHFSIIAHICQMRSRHSIEQGDPCMLFLPLFHVYGLCVLGMCSHAYGGEIVIIPKFIPDDFLHLVGKYKPRRLNLVPPVMVMLAKHPRLSDYNLSSVTEVGCGAAPLSQRVEEAVKNRLNLTLITQGYGMTETGVTHVNTQTEYKYKSVGKLVTLVEMKIVDVETGKPLGIHEEGEIWVRGPQVCMGYLNRPKETREMFSNDGWVRTGDIGREDEDGFLFIVDRMKELIKYKGFQVAPATLEDILLHHEAVADAGVVGVPDEEAGELPRAYVVVRAGKTATPDELIRFVAGQVPPHMKLRGGVEFVHEIPRSLSGKILRKTLRQKAMSVNSKL